MEFPERIQTAARKENIPPALSCCVTPREQGHIQKNVSINLFRASGSPSRVLWPQTSSTIRGSNLTRENVQSRLRAASGIRESHGLFQTNLLCPSSSSWGIAKETLPQQQSNLGSNLQRRRWGSGTLQVGLKRTPLTELPERRHDVPRATSRMEKRDRYLLKRQCGLFSVSKRSSEDLKASRGSSSPTQFSVVASLDTPPNSCPPPLCPFSRISDSSSLGLALTLDNLKSSTLVDGHSSPEGLQTIVRSSQSSADPCRSLQGLKKAATSMEAGASVPHESQTSPRVPQPSHEPQISTWAVQKVLEALVEGSSSGQMRNKWRTTPGSTLLACQGGYSRSSICCLRSSSGRQPATNEKAAWGRLKAQGYPRTLDPEELPSGAFCGSELYLKDLPLDVSSFKGLESSLKRLCAESSLNKGLFVDDTQEEQPPTARPSGGPEVPILHPFGKGVGDPAIHEAGDNHGEAGEAPIIASSVDEASPFTANQKVSPFGEAIWKGPRKCFQPADSTEEPDPDLTRRRENVSFADRRNQRKAPSAGRTKDGAEAPSREERDDGTALTNEILEDDDASVGRSNGSHPLLEKCFVAWHGHVVGKRDAAQALRVRHLLHKGVGALQWAVRLRSIQREAAQNHHALAVLAGSFRKWQDTAAKQRERPGLEEPGALSCGKGGLPGRKRKEKWPALCQLPPECLQVSRTERLLWMQLRGGEEGGMLSEEEEEEEMQDLWRLAGKTMMGCLLLMEVLSQKLGLSACGPWDLQKETLANDGGPLRAARVLLGKKKLGDAFKRWRSHGRENQRIWLLASRIQSGRIGRCLRAWKGLAQRRRQSEAVLNRLQVRSLRVCFQQWSLMVQAREKAKRAVAELLTLKQQSSCKAKPSCSSPNAPGAQRGPDRARWPRKSGEDTLEYLFHLRALQEAFRTWKARCWEAQQAGAFYQGLALRQLREALERWWRRSPHLNPLGLAEGSLLASLDSQESPFSSGLPSTSSSQEKEIQPVEPSLISLSSLATVEEPSLLPPPGSHCPRRNSDRGNPIRVANRFLVQDPPLWLNWQAARKFGRLWRHKVRLHRFQEARDARQLVKAWLLWKDACRTELVVRALRWQRWAQWGWRIWRQRCLRLQVAQHFREAEEERLLSTAFGKWRRLAAASRAQAE